MSSAQPPTDSVRPARPGEWVDRLRPGRRRPRAVIPAHRHRPLHLPRIRRARAGIDLDEGVAGRRPGRRTARGRRLEGLRNPRPVVHPRPRQGRPHPRLRRRLPPLRQPAVHRQGQHAAVHVPAPPVVLRPRGQAARRPARAGTRPDRQGRQLADSRIGRHLRRIHLRQSRPERRAAGRPSRPPRSPRCSRRIASTRWSR